MHKEKPFLPRDIVRCSSGYFARVTCVWEHGVIEVMFSDRSIAGVDPSQLERVWRDPDPYIEHASERTLADLHQETLEAGAPLVDGIEKT